MALFASIFRSQIQAANLSAPTERFSNAKKTGEDPKAIGVCDNAAGIAGTIHCEAFNETVNFRTNMVLIPVITDAAVGGFTGCTVIYFY